MYKIKVEIVHGCAEKKSLLELLLAMIQPFKIFDKKVEEQAKNDDFAAGMMNAIYLILSLDNMPAFLDEKLSEQIIAIIYMIGKNNQKIPTKLNVEKE